MSSGKAIALIAYLLVVGVVIGMVIHSVPARSAEVAACEVQTSVVVNDDVRNKLEERGGKLVELTGKQAADFQAKVEELLGAKAPFQADEVAIGVGPNGTDLWPVALSQDGCIKSLLRLPADFIRALVSIPATKPVDGEKVD